MVAPWVDH
jgi:hypothetical protein